LENTKNRLDTSYQAHKFKKFYKKKRINQLPIQEREGHLQHGDLQSLTKRQEIQIDFQQNQNHPYFDQNKEISNKEPSKKIIESNLGECQSILFFARTQG
jgi:hypothetical protein